MLLKYLSTDVFLSLATNWNFC